MKVSDPERNLHIFEKQLAGGHKLCTREKFYYARELFYHQQYEKALSVYQDFLVQPDAWTENLIDACQQGAECEIHLHHPEQALQLLFQSFLYDCPRAEICCAVGSLKMQLQNWQEAIFWYQTALHCPKQKAGFCCPDYEDFIPYLQLCVCYDRIGNFSKAEAYNEKAGRIKPGNQSVIYNREYFSRRKEIDS